MAPDVSDPQTTAKRLELIREGALAGSPFEGPEGVEQIAALLAQNAHPGFVTVMVSQDGIPREYPGIEGFRKALADWISPYERFRLEIDEAIPVADKIVLMVRQIGTTKHGGVEIETPSAAVWALLDGQIRQATFYLDPKAALTAAGLEPRD